MNGGLIKGTCGRDFMLLLIDGIQLEVAQATQHYSDVYGEVFTQTYIIIVSTNKHMEFSNKPPLCLT